MDWCELRYWDRLDWIGMVWNVFIGLVLVRMGFYGLVWIGIDLCGSKWIGID